MLEVAGVGVPESEGEAASSSRRFFRLSSTAERSKEDILAIGPGPSAAASPQILRRPPSRVDFERYSLFSSSWLRIAPRTDTISAATSAHLSKTKRMAGISRSPCESAGSRGKQKSKGQESQLTSFRGPASREPWRKGCKASVLSSRVPLQFGWMVWRQGSLPRSGRPGKWDEEESLDQNQPKETPPDRPRVAFSSLSNSRDGPFAAISAI